MLSDTAWLFYFKASVVPGLTQPDSQSIKMKSHAIPA